MYKVPQKYQAIKNLRQDFQTLDTNRLEVLKSHYPKLRTKNRFKVFNANIKTTRKIYSKQILFDYSVYNDQRTSKFKGHLFLVLEPSSVLQTELSKADEFCIVPFLLSTDAPASPQVMDKPIYVLRHLLERLLERAKLDSLLDNVQALSDFVIPFFMDYENAAHQFIYYDTYILIYEDAYLVLDCNSQGHPLLKTVVFDTDLSQSKLASLQPIKRQLDKNKSHFAMFPAKHFSRLTSSELSADEALSMTKYCKIPS